MLALDQERLSPFLTVVGSRPRNPEVVQTNNSNELFPHRRERAPTPQVKKNSENQVLRSEDQPHRPNSIPPPNDLSLSRESSFRKNGRAPIDEKVTVISPNRPSSGAPTKTNIITSLTRPSRPNTNHPDFVRSDSAEKGEAPSDILSESEAARTRRPATVERNFLPSDNK